MCATVAGSPPPLARRSSRIRAEPCARANAASRYGWARLTASRSSTLRRQVPSASRRTCETPAARARDHVRFRVRPARGHGVGQAGAADRPDADLGRHRAEPVAELGGRRPCLHRQRPHPVLRRPAVRDTATAGRAARDVHHPSDHRLDPEHDVRLGHVLDHPVLRSGRVGDGRCHQRLILLHLQQPGRPYRYSPSTSTATGTTRSARSPRRCRRSSARPPAEPGFRSAASVQRTRRGSVPSPVAAVTKAGTSGYHEGGMSPTTSR